MTDKCKLSTCDNKLVHTEGRRPKEFCSPECRSKFHNMKKVKGVGRGRPKGSKNKLKATSEKFQKELQEEHESRKNPLINAARGRDESGVNEDEIRGDNVEFIEPTPESYNGNSTDRVKFDEAALFDFGTDRFLDIEKHTKYPKKDRPTNKGEAITWDNLKKESDQKIKESWSIYKQSLNK